jgi:hypothetical protein
MAGNQDLVRVMHLMNWIIKTRIATDNPTLPMKVAAPFNRTCSKPLTYFKLQKYLKRVFTTKQKKYEIQFRRVRNKCHWKASSTLGHSKITCRGVSSPLSSLIAAMTWPHSVCVPTPVTCAKRNYPMQRKRRQTSNWQISCLNRLAIEQ